MSRNSAIEARNIRKTFSTDIADNVILKDVSVKIEKGEFVSIMGPSGAGKSTLLYLLSGLDRPSAGEVLLNGRDIAGLGDREMSVLRRRNIGFVFQFYNLIPNLNVEENILLPVLLDGKNRRSCRERLEQILEITGLSERRRHTPRQLSGGQQQRVAVARALFGDPEIIFADEPTGNLDSKSGQDILELLKRISSEQNKTILMVTHSREAARYSSRMIYVRDGRIEE